MLETERFVKFTEYSDLLTYNFSLIFLMFIYFERERERERERIPSRLCTNSVEPDTGLDLTNCEIMT